EARAERSFRTDPGSRALAFASRPAQAFLAKSMVLCRVATNRKARAGQASNVGETRSPVSEDVPNIERHDPSATLRIGRWGRLSARRSCGQPAPRLARQVLEPTHSGPLPRAGRHQASASTPRDP